MRPSFVRLLAGGIAASVACWIWASDGLGKIKSVKPLPDHVLIESENGSIRIIPASKDIIRIETSQSGSGEFLPGSGLVSDHTTGIEGYQITAGVGGISIITPATEVFVDRESSLLSFFDNQGRLLLEEGESVDNSKFPHTAVFTGIEPDENIFKSRSLPYFASDYGYGVLFDNPDYSGLSIGDTVVYKTSASGPLAYYFLNSSDGTLAGVTENHSLLTGRQPQIPFGSLGIVPHGDYGVSWKSITSYIDRMLDDGLSGKDFAENFSSAPSTGDIELYSRDLELKTFSPFFAIDVNTVSGKHKEIATKYKSVRNLWLPYNYTLAYENAAFGIPPARPLNFSGENEEKQFAEITDEFFWGENVLVTPVTTKGCRVRNVIFPAGEWHEWNNPQKIHKGGSSAMVKVRPDEIPVFIRQGAFIPLYPRSLNNTTEYDPRFLTVKYFPSEEETTFTLFDDDRTSANTIEDGSFQLMTFGGNRGDGVIALTLEADKGHYDGMPPLREITFIIENTTHRPLYVETSGCQLLPTDGSGKNGWLYDPVKKTVMLTVLWEYAPLNIHLHF